MVKLYYDFHKMVRAKYILFILALSFTASAFGQEQIKLLHHNVLYYGKNVYQCTDQSNNVNVKTDGLKQIFDYVKPDIFTCNEMDAEQQDVDYLLDNALNQNGRTSFVAAKMVGTYLVNQLYYNSDKLGLSSVESMVMGSYERNANFYKLYSKENTLKAPNDTAFIHIVLLHLKAGDKPENETTRASQITKVMNKIDALGWDENVFIVGDLNFYKASEAAYQSMTDSNRGGVYFKDPVSQEGYWHNNGNYSLYHTQSTHSVYTGCAVSGGSDDRFDFILCDSKTKDGQAFWKYVIDSYDVVGQDGKHFNKAITDLPDSNDNLDAIDYPESLKQAIYNTSDHYPVVLTIGQKATTIKQNRKNNVVVVENPFTEEIKIKGLPQGKVTFDVYSVLGSVVTHGMRAYEGGELRIKISQPSGIYIVKIVDAKGKVHGLRVIKK